MLDFEELRVLMREKLKDTEWGTSKYFEEVWMAGLRVKAFSMLDPRDGWKVLDIGCGDGWSTIQNALVYSQVFFLGIDLYEAEDAHANAKLFELCNCDFIEGNIFTMNFRETFEAVMLYFSLGNICAGKEDVGTLLRKIREFLKRKGKLLIVEPFQDDFKEINKLNIIYGIPGIKGVGEEKETILNLNDVVNCLSILDFHIVKKVKYEFSWKVSEREFLEYFGLPRLPFKLSEYYYRDKPKRATVIVAFKH